MKRKAAEPTILLIAFILALPPGVGAENARLHPDLAPFAPFVGRTWKALVDAEKKIYDVARWQVALAGRAVRIRHAVADGAYGGETIIMWDEASEAYVFTYFTTAGFLTRGTMRFDDAGRLVASETIHGRASGVREVRSTSELTSRGELRVRTRKLRGDVWEDATEAIYVEDPAAEVHLPAGAPPA